MTRDLAFAAASAFLLVGIPVAHAQGSAPETRTEVPIQQVTLSDGTIRYWIPTNVGGTSIDALLDTGTTGLRILPDVISSADTPEGPSDSIAVGHTTLFIGQVSTGALTVGGLSASSPFELIKNVCRDTLSNCRTTRGPIDRFGHKYGIGAEGLPGEGFHALIGIKMGPSDITNPLVAIGAKRWIVKLPRPHASTPGKLVLNPRDDEVADFSYIPLVTQIGTYKDIAALHDAMSGCLQKLGSNERACGALTFDTGYSAVHVFNSALEQGTWPENTQAEMTIFDGTEPRVGASFEAEKVNGSQIFVTKHRDDLGPVIFAGVTPYFAFEVLYDPSKNVIGLRPRDIVVGMPAGRLLRQ